MPENDIIIWKKSEKLLPLIKNLVAKALASHQSQKFLCQNNPNKIKLNVTKYLGTSKSSLEVILRKLPGGGCNLPPTPLSPGMNRVIRKHKKSSSYIHTIIYKNQKPNNYLIGAFYSPCYLVF